MLEAPANRASGAPATGTAKRYNKKGGELKSPGRKRAKCTLHTVTRQKVRNNARRYMAQDAEGYFFKKGQKGYWPQGFRRATRVIMTGAEQFSDGGREEEVVAALTKLISNNNDEMRRFRLTPKEVEKRTELSMKWIAKYGAYRDAKTGPTKWGLECQVAAATAAAATLPAEVSRPVPSSSSHDHHTSCSAAGCHRFWWK